MIAFVLSGGGSLGAIQAGMLEALLEHDVVPDLLIGTSVGAANAAFLASEPSLPRARELSSLWAGLRARKLFPLGPLRTFRALRSGSLFGTAPLTDLVTRHTPYRNIESAAVALRIVATDFEDGSEFVFDSGSVVDAVLASTALPGIFPPHAVGDHLYLDGGLVDHTPLSPALAMGADRIYVLSCGFPCPPHGDHRSARSVLAHSMGIVLSQRIRLETNSVRGGATEIISIPPVCTHAGLRDLRRAPSLTRQARDQTRQFLAGEPCAPCHHRATDRSTSSQREEVARLKSDLSIA